MTESISIHAPTRGATEFERCEKPEGVYFNPRSYKRSDMVLFFCPQILQDFNPRSYKRSDKRACVKHGIGRISIHAPTRGATAKMHNNPYTYL